jgi:3-phosphoshikimate 1-carboxyvinyltransferase
MLRVKESDRLAAVASEMGAKITEFPDGLEISGNAPLTGVEVESYHDHRLTMSLAIASLGTKGQTTIHGAEAASISYPNFIPTLQELTMDN